ncbi:Trp-Asp repeats containing protein, putative [Trichomonas vaginalis G3]|uniref:Trp-Asp repeats containing protein, putative n=1 Tax=Trichomonas vaginalis (strain ATCC PRA-98 / G3) TaxID=412133 RepID=A2FIT8_TRIV3|nr:WD repeat-containing protein family [Trichomonas vaginalis G3]EAX95191.1 Trp-Asp repeats containing protein, putative [Trichomonas vaginalis G3]KAI5516161.1 WD repeat-containing protein family [Trichomonas vaginalis G3]|eukprot:XP_001308121.1 Trp-Asp repeats containing protein [Trichomonas vaginalis G3]
MWQLKGEITPDLNDPVSCLQFSPSGDRFAAGFSNGIVTIYDMENGSLIKKVFAHKKGVNQLKWSNDSSILISCSDDGNINLYRTTDFEIISECTGHHSYVFSCDISPSKLRIASGSYDESVRIWETATGKCLRMISAHNDPVSSVVFNHDGQFVISSSWDGFCRIFETFSGLCVKSVNLEGIPISHMEIAPNDSYLLVSLLQSKIKLISLRDQKLKALYTGHENYNFPVFSGFLVRENENGKKTVEVYSGTENSYAVGWDLATMEPKWSIPMEFDVIELPPEPPKVKKEIPKPEQPEQAQQPAPEPPQQPAQPEQPPPIQQQKPDLDSLESLLNSPPPKPIEQPQAQQNTEQPKSPQKEVVEEPPVEIPIRYKAVKGFPSIAVHAHPSGNFLITATGENGAKIALWERHADTDQKPVTFPPPLPPYAFCEPPKAKGSKDDSSDSEPDVMPGAAAADPIGGSSSD